MSQAGPLHATRRYITIIMIITIIGIIFVIIWTIIVINSTVIVINTIIVIILSMGIPQNPCGEYSCPT